MSAAERWAEALAAWAIPEEILQQAPESPWRHDPALFAVDPTALPVDTPSTRAAREGLPDGGGVLDVGCGGGASSLVLADRAGVITGVDTSAEMLASFAAAADSLGVAHAEVLGLWPDSAETAPAADVVICHHVLYNVAALPPFLEGLQSKATGRVVVEIPEHHPTSRWNPLWERFWGLARPTSPTADDAIAVLREIGVEPTVERFPGAARRTGDAAAEARRARVHLCLPPEREPEVAAAMAELGVPLAARDLVTLWWRPAAS
jgi:SAM-dependent methyltransferase